MWKLLGLFDLSVVWKIIEVLRAQRAEQKKGTESRPSPAEGVLDRVGVGGGPSPPMPEVPEPRQPLSPAAEPDLPQVPPPKFLRQRGFSERSRRNLQGIHPDLQKVVDRALTLSELDFVVTEGRRSVEKQREYLAAGASRTMKSRHLTGHAIDMVALHETKVSYDKDHMRRVAEGFKAASRELRIPIVWGGDWKSFQDTPHIELDKKHYPEEA